VVTHRNNVLSLADKILLLVDGQIAVYGNATRSSDAPAGGCGAGTRRVAPAVAQAGAQAK
jgi:ABC-type protease/lipase transport system fused ATPase/permease subunit